MRKYTIPEIGDTRAEYILSDHLGSASITTNADGDKTSEVHYTPWGEVLSSWSASASLPMEYTFTGQMSYMDDPITSGTTEGFGLMFFNARWLDPAIGRFAQADSIVPSGVQGLDRYAYVNNNPLRYTDPTGHHCEDEDVNGYCPSDVGYNIPGYIPPPHVKLNEKGKISPSGVVMITCGVEPLDKGACNNGSSLSLYKEWALRQGYGVVINDVDACGTKYACSNKVLSAMQLMLGDDPSLNFILAGHSAGADATILAANRAIGTEIQGHIQNIIILGQSGNYTDPGIGVSSTNDIANNSLLPAYGNKIIVGDIYAYGGNLIKVPRESYVQGLTDHMGLTTDMTLFLTILDTAGLPR